MPWVKLDAGFPDHPKVVAAGWKAAWLYVCGLTYCSRYLTDGRIPKAHVIRLSDVSRPNFEAQRLVKAGLWLDMVDHYQVHDYTEWQVPAEKVDEYKEKGKERARRSYQKRHSSPEESEVFAKSSPEQSSQDVDVDVDVDTPPPQVLLQRTSSRGQESEEEEDSLRQAMQLLACRPPGLPAVANVNAWLQRTAQDIRARPHVEHTPQREHAMGTPAKRPDCATCDGLSLVEAGDGYQPCPDCTDARSHA